MPYEPGPFSHTHGYLQWGGTLPGNEIWSCGLRMAALNEVFGDGLALSDSGMENYLDHYTTKLTEFHQRAVSNIGSGAKMNFVKFNKIGLDGKYVNQGATHVRFINPPIAGAIGGNISNQIALCVTLTTDVQRGPASKGRFYLPAPVIAIDDTGRISAAKANEIMASVRTLLEDLSDSPGLDSDVTPDVVVMSRKPGAPAARYVTGLRIGRVLDTQRRRRNNMDEAYVTDVVDFGTF